MKPSVEGIHFLDENVRFNARVFGNFKIISGFRVAVYGPYG
jgi:hypothetical protein